MKPCLCFRLYRVKKPVRIKEYAFSGSLCRIQEFETLDGLHYCMTIFSLSDYKHLHFPHDEFQSLVCKLNSMLSTYAIMPTAKTTSMSCLKPFNGDFKIKFGIHSLTIGRVTAFGLLKTSPFSSNENSFTCDLKWDICTCSSCPIFKRLIEYEATASMRFPNHKLENVILFQN